MLKFSRVNEIAHRIEGYSGSDSNYRIINVELLSEEGTEKWSMSIQRKKDDGKDFVQDIMNRMRDYGETVHFRVLFASINESNEDIVKLKFVVEDLTEEKKKDD